MGHGFNQNNSAVLNCNLVFALYIYICACTQFLWNYQPVDDDDDGDGGNGGDDGGDGDHKARASLKVL
jgi:hypothetical protein